MGRNGAPWYNEACRLQRVRFWEIESRYRKTGEEEDRLWMCRERNNYRRICRKSRTDYNRQEAQRLLVLSKKDPKAFWNDVNSNKAKDKLPDCDFYEHFKGLATRESGVSDIGKQEISDWEQFDYEKHIEKLDVPFELEELEKAIRSLKLEKSAGPDFVLNEFI